MHYLAIHFKIRQVTRKLGQTAMMSAVGGDAQKPTGWMDEVASSAVLEAAFEWLCKRRVDYSDSADVWNVRFRWAEIKLQLQHDLLGGQYHFSPLRRVQAHGECIELWNALDALVLKALAIV